MKNMEIRGVHEKYENSCTKTKGFSWWNRITELTENRRSEHADQYKRF